jgi:uncharacterized Fe-S cluster-containing protein
LIHTVGNDGDLEVVEIEYFDPSWGECVLEGWKRVIDDLESDNVHTTLRIKKKDYKQKW